MDGRLARHLRIGKLDACLRTHFVCPKLDQRLLKLFINITYLHIEQVWCSVHTFTLSGYSKLPPAQSMFFMMSFPSSPSSPCAARSSKLPISHTLLDYLVDNTN